MQKILKSFGTQWKHIDAVLLFTLDFFSFCRFAQKQADSDTRFRSMIYLMFVSGQAAFVPNRTEHLAQEHAISRSKSAHTGVALKAIAAPLGRWSDATKNTKRALSLQNSLGILPICLDLNHRFDFTLAFLVLTQGVSSKLFVSNSTALLFLGGQRAFDQAWISCGRLTKPELH